MKTGQVLAITAGVLIAGCLLLRKSDNGGNGSNGEITFTFKIANPPAVNGFWQLAMFENHWQPGGTTAKTYTFYPGEDTHIGWNEIVSVTLTDWIYPSKLMMSVYQWIGPDTVFQIGGMQSVNPDLDGYNPAFVADPGSWALNYATGAITPF